MRLPHPIPRALATACLALSFAAPRASADDAWSVRGYAELRLYDYLGAETEPFEADVRVRPHFTFTFDDDSLIVFEPELRRGFGRGDDAFDDWEDQVGIERLFAEVSLHGTRLTVGKQAVNWGSGQVFNPTDVFDDVFLRDVWAEQSGHTGAKLAVPLAATSEVTVLVACDDQFQQALGAVRGRTTVGTTDLALSISRDPFRRADVYGVDVKGEATVGLWVEAAWNQPWDGPGFLESIAGVDYTFGLRNGLYLAGQYYRDGSGASARERYDIAALARGERSTLARDYALVTGRLAWSENLTIATLTIDNIDDGSLLATVYGEYTRIPAVTLSLGTTWLGGRADGEFNPPAALDPQGLLPDAILYLWARYHF